MVHVQPGLVAAHAADTVWLTDNVPDIPDIGRTEHPACMPDDCKVDSVVESYKNYYREYKKRLAVWEHRATTPSWFV